MSNTLYLDLETYCETPIGYGVHRYSEDAEILLFAYAIDDSPAQVWDVANQGTGMPSELSRALTDSSVELCAHNSGFDRTVLNACGVEIGINRWYDTMVQAYAHSMPGGLGVLCEILGLPVDQSKDKDGKKLMHLFCKPRPKNIKLRRATIETHPDEWARFVDYARRDVEAMREVRKRLPTWNFKGGELALWHLDQKINDRGVLVDIDLINAAMRAVDRAQVGLSAQCSKATDGEVGRATERDALLQHILESYGVRLPDMQKDTLERRLTDETLPQSVRDLINIRLQASSSSTAKFKKMFEAASSRDHRVRGTLQFNGAQRTGRWAGRLIQPQNFPRPSMENERIELGIAAMKTDCEDLIFDNVMDLTANALRGCFIAPRGKKLVAADLSNIEGRALAWLAGETWKLKAFEDFDNGVGHDLYKLAYARAFGVNPGDVSKDDRQIGKVMELMLGYEGGVGAFLTGAASYGFDIEIMARTVWPTVPDEIREQTARWWAVSEKEGRTFGLSSVAFQSCDALKRLWREANPNIANWWAELKQAVIDAIIVPGTTFDAGRVKIRRDGRWLKIRLPSGRLLCYPDAMFLGGKILYKGINPYSRKWCNLQSYGGKFSENITQAVSRDILAYNMPGIEAAEYEIVLSIHDEVITEAPDSPQWNAPHLSSLLANNPPWSQGLPLAAAGFEAYRYRKE